MNIAVLFNAAEDGDVGTDVLLAGKELYCYSLKTFYLHPCIDYIAVMWMDVENTGNIRGHIEKWRKESSTDKPVKIYQENQELWQILSEFERGMDENGKHDAGVYVLHDVRYPFVTANMIYKVVEKAALYGIAVTDGKVRDDLIVCLGQEMLLNEDLRYVKYPVAVQVGHKMLGRVTGIAALLDRCIEGKPYLCNWKDWNPLVSNDEDIKKAEAILHMDRIKKKQKRWIEN